MDVSHILDNLNAAQREAVSSAPTHQLVLAGAGSGKTRVLVHRIAWLLQVEGVSPYGVMAVTFTNKAAGEMRARTEQLLGMPARGLWVGTFHGLAHRLLRSHWQEAGLPKSFQILDSEDQQRMVKRVVRALELDEARWPPKQAAWYINARKDEGQRPQHVEDHGDPVTQQLIRIYTGYEAACKKAGVVDFAELLLRALELIRDNDSLQRHYRERFRHLLVDEFQDTNTIQYAWLRLLAGKTNFVFAVGDDDQSIYGWRGAKVENILNFDRDFPGGEKIRLEQNYRSTANILAAANALIRNNTGRLGKDLWTEGDDGDAITLYTAYNESDEANFVLNRISEWVQQGNRRDECAILYRSNAQSRVFEENLIAENMPYRVYGGLRFFERAEIKDALGYLRLLANVDDDQSFERVVNQPPRGVGDKTLQLIREHALINARSLWQAAEELVQHKALSGRASNAVQGFLQRIKALSEEIIEQELADQVEAVVKGSGLLEHFKQDRSEKGQSRVENLEELVSAARAMQFLDEDLETMTPLDAFLSSAALEAGQAQGEAWEDCVQMMTLHSAKGLEFPLVFLVGMEEGLFPNQMSLDEAGRLEEERRLAYVGITRAQRKLFITLAEHRRIYGRETYAQPSRFVAELPKDLIHDVRPRVSVSRPAYPATANRWQEQPDTEFGIGQRVMHTKFGEGVVLGYEGQGSHARVQINFADAGSKWLVLAYAKLTTL